MRHTPLVIVFMFQLATYIMFVLWKYVKMLTRHTRSTTKGVVITASLRAFARLLLFRLIRARCHFN